MPEEGGRPEITYSDNGSTFKAADKLLKRVQQDERFHDLLAGLAIKRQFNLSCAHDGEVSLNV